MTPEFSRVWRIDTLGAEPRAVRIAAEEAERAALAERFGLVAVHRLEADATLSREGETARAAGILRAAVTQSCVASGEPVEEEVEAPFRIEFRPSPGSGGGEEIELGEGDMDTVFFDGAAIDLGEAVAETLSLSLDPWPRAPGAEAALRKAGVKDEEEAAPESSPFAALGGLKDKLGK
ncbi:MAG TPA: YceD family protein [Allosphingosinicella sp.]|nr:YceD family protein [Allosphingosinicella sp.]